MRSGSAEARPGRCDRAWHELSARAAERAVVGAGARGAHARSRTVTRLAARPRWLAKTRGRAGRDADRVTLRTRELVRLRRHEPGRAGRADRARIRAGARRSP